MAADPKKVAPRTLFEAERIRAEKRYRYWLKIAMNKIKTAIYGVHDYNELQAELTKLSATKAFSNLCKQAARQIVTMLSVGQLRSWRAAASASSQGRKIFLALQRELKTTSIGDAVDAIIRQNAQLIKTVPQSVALEFSRMAGESQFAGMRPDELLAEFKKRAPHLTDVEARRIARTESSKAATALAQARAEKLGLNFYIWLTARDMRVRDAHKVMQGVVCAWNDPPNPELLAGEKRTYGNYHPGGIFNCRCVPQTVVDITDIEFPAKVHYHGSIVTVKNIQDFRKLFNGTV